jgi:(1->4)-alpha-D-glucan 1-alpha-D-glucosylmutase
VFAQGDYEPLEISGPHRDHVIAFARRRGRHAVIVAATRWYTPLSEQGRRWPQGSALEGEIHLDGYALEGTRKSDSARVPLATLFAHLPVAAIKASTTDAAKSAPKTNEQFA